MPPSCPNHPLPTTFFPCPSVFLCVTNKVMTAPLPRQPNQSLLEGMEVLLAVARSREPVRVRAMARQLGLTPTRLQRYMATLAHCGILRQLPDRRYGPGPGMHALSAISLSASGLAARGMEVLPQLADLHCVVALGVLWRDQVSYLYFQAPDKPPARSLGHAEDFPARESVIGRVLLATQEPHGESGPIKPAEAHAIRRLGYAQMLRPAGKTGLAVPVGDPPVAGLALEGNFSANKIPELVGRMREAAQRLQVPPTPINPKETIDENV